MKEPYFIGIALPPKLDKTLRQLKLQLYDKKTMLRPLVPHVTLLHPTGLNDFAPSELVPLIQAAAKPYLPLNLELTAIDFFDESVCLIKVESLQLYSLQQKLVKLLPQITQDAHYQRIYLPHITLAQTPREKALDTSTTLQEIKQALSLPIRTEVTKLTCFRRIHPREYIKELI